MHNMANLSNGIPKSCLFSLLYACNSWKNPRNYAGYQTGCPWHIICRRVKLLKLRGFFR